MCSPQLRRSTPTCLQHAQRYPPTSFASSQLTRRRGFGAAGPRPDNTAYLCELAAKSVLNPAYFAHQLCNYQGFSCCGTHSKCHSWYLQFASVEAGGAMLTLRPLSQLLVKRRPAGASKEKRIIVFICFLRLGRMVPMGKTSVRCRRAGCWKAESNGNS